MERNSFEWAWVSDALGRNHIKFYYTCFVTKRRMLEQNGRVQQAELTNNVTKITRNTAPQDTSTATLCAINIICTAFGFDIIFQRVINIAPPRHCKCSPFPPPHMMCWHWINNIQNVYQSGDIYIRRMWPGFSPSFHIVSIDRHKRALTVAIVACVCVCVGVQPLQSIRINLQFSYGKV